ncbi:hypothetical protein MMC14_006110 [Varicellaria rhodocarpa]|nr:hypothetical protein [Varicellaria rhodocarpa]
MGLTIVDLPVEILDDIASRLGDTDLLALRTVCRIIEQCTFRRVRDAFFTTLLVNLDGKGHLKLQAFSENEQLKNCVQCLYVTRYKTKHLTKPGRRLMENSSDGWTHLKEIYMDGCTRIEGDMGWSTKLILGATNLQSLDIVGCLDMTGLIKRLSAQEILPQLQRIGLASLQVSTTSLSQLMLHLKDSLHDLSFSEVIIIRANVSLISALMEWGEKLPLLQQFGIYNCSFQIDKKRFAITFPSLHKNTEGLTFKIWTKHRPYKVEYRGQSAGKALKVIAAWKVLQKPKSV